MPHIQIEDSKKSLLESIYLTYQEDYKNNLLESYTSHTNRGLQEKPVGIHLPHTPIEHYKNNMLESIYLKYQEDYKNSMLESIYLTYQ